jgi:hypothetical protein
VTSSDHWARTEKLFAAAVALPPADRAAFLSRECADDPTLRSEVEALLAHHDSAPEFLERGISALSLWQEPASTTPPLSAGQQLGPYVVERELGHGGMGVVYLARDSRLGKAVALKLLPSALMTDPVRRERLRREAEAAARLSHPGIAAVFTLEDIDGHLFIVSELVRGSTLREALAARGVFSGVQLLDIATAIADALAHAHRHGIVHRDLKLDNVMLSEHGIKVLDFGLATMMPTAEETVEQARLTMEGVVLGTPAYMSPEQLLHEPVDARTDQFNFGVLVYELATGRHPFAEGDMQAAWSRVLTAPAPSLANYGVSIPEGLSGVVERCLAKSPNERYQTTDELSNVLRAIQEGKRVPLPSTSPSWFEIHQIFTALFYALMLVPMWAVRQILGPPWGAVLFVLGVMVTVVPVSLRLHLAFVAHHYYAPIREPFQQVSRMVFVGDVLVCALWLVSGGLLFGAGRPALASLLAGAAIIGAIAFVVIERNTKRDFFLRNRRTITGPP